MQKQNTTKTLILIDDDEDDLEIFISAITDLDVKVQTYKSGTELFEALKSNATDPPFLIVCDMNIPGEDGIDIRKKLNSDPQTRYAAIPFVYWSTSATQLQVRSAYDLNIQGFFIKPSVYKEVKEMLYRMVQYWEYCVHPK